MKTRVTPRKLPANPKPRRLVGLLGQVTALQSLCTTRNASGHKKPLPPTKMVEEVASF